MAIELIKPNPTLFQDQGYVHSVNPPETMFGYLYFSHMIPPFRPEHSLILGYGKGTVPNLMRMIWGPNLKVTGVDKEKHPSDGYYEYKNYQVDAYEYVKDNGSSVLPVKYDYIVVDLFNGAVVPDFVYDPDFVTKLYSMCTKLLSINIPESDLMRMKVYMESGFECDKVDQVEGNRVMFWSVPNGEKK